MTRQEDAYLMLLDLAAASSATLNETKVAKLLYLADLRAQRHGDLGSGSDWFWHNHGPWDRALPGVRLALVAAQRVVQERFSLGWGVFERSVRLPRRCDAVERVDLQARLQGYGYHLLAVVNEFGQLTASELRDYTYDTAPMLKVQETGTRGIDLDLSAMDERDCWGLVTTSELSQRQADANRHVDAEHVKRLHGELKTQRSLADVLR